MNNEEIFKEFYDQLKIIQKSDKTSDKKRPDDIITNYNKIMKKKEADQKFEFRDRLLKLISKLVWVQLLFFNIIILLVIFSVIFNFSFLNNNGSGIILDFLKYYISVTIVELLGMLLFVIQYVFKTQI